MRNRHAASVLVALLGVAGLSTCSSPSKSSPAETCKKIVSTLGPVTDKGVRRATGPALEVDAANAAFTPTCVTDVPRGTFALNVHNTGLVIHDVAIPEQHIDVDIPPRRTVTIQIRIGSTPVVYSCRYHRALGMVGVLTPASG
jgi:plastocyanin